VKLDASGASAQLCHDAVHILMRLMSISAHWLATSTRPAWELACRTVLNRPYTGCRKALELLACLSEHCEPPAVLGDTLCQTISWAVRCEMRPPRAPVAGALADVDVKIEAKEEEGRDGEHEVQSSAQSLAKCILAVFHTLPAAVRHVHAENMVPWALDYLMAVPPRAPELRSALLAALATNLCECPSLAPNVLRLPELMHEAQIKDAISTCLRKVLAKLLVSPAHGDALLAHLSGRKDHGGAEQGASRGDSSQDVDMREASSEHGGGKKRRRSHETSDAGVNKRTSLKNTPQNTKNARGATSVQEMQTSAVLQELLVSFFRACLNSRRARECGGDAELQQSATAQYGLLTALCIVSDFYLQGAQNPGLYGAKVPSCILIAVVEFILLLHGTDGAVNHMASGSNFLPFLRALHTCCSCKLPGDVATRIGAVIQDCVKVCGPLVSKGASCNDDSRAQVIEMLSTLSSSNRLPANNVAMDFFVSAVQSADNAIAAAAVRDLPTFLLRSPASARQAGSCISLLGKLLDADGTSLEIKVLIPQAMAHLLCAVCALQSCGSEPEKAIKCEAVPSHGTCDPVEHFVAKQSLFSESQGGGCRSKKCCGDDIATVAQGKAKAIWCCADRYAARYGSAASEKAPPLPFLAARSSEGDRGKPSAASRGGESAVRDLATRVFESFRGVLEAEYTAVQASVLRNVLWALPLVVIHMPCRDLQSHSWLLERCLEIATGPRHCLKIRSCAAAAIGGFASGTGGWLTALSGNAALFQACDKVIVRVRDVYEKLSPEDPDSEFKAAGCIQVEAFLSASLNYKQSEGTWDSFKILCTDLVVTAVQHLSQGIFRKSCGAYGSLQFVAEAHGVSVETMLGESNCREDVVMVMINCMGDEGVGDQDRGVRMIKAYVDMFGDGTGRRVGDNDERCRKFVETIFKSIAHKLLLDGNNRQIQSVARYLNYENPGVLVAENLQYIIRHLCFNFYLKPNERARVDEAKALLKEYITEDAETATRDQHVCSDHILRSLLEEISRFANVEDKKRGHAMIREFISWLLKEKCLIEKAEHRPLEVYLGIEKHQDFYTKWLYDLNKDFFDESKSGLNSPELRKGRREALMILDYTIPLLGKMLDQMLAVILSVLNRAKLVDELKEKVCDVWHTLIHSCGWQSKGLQSRLPQIVITLLQLGAKFPDKVKPSLLLLVVDWRERHKFSKVKVV
jgi:hypothetical protein